MTDLIKRVGAFLTGQTERHEDPAPDPNLWIYCGKAESILGQPASVVDGLIDSGRLRSMVRRTGNVLMTYVSIEDVQMLAPQPVVMTAISHSTEPGSTQIEAPTRPVPIHVEAPTGTMEQISRPVAMAVPWQNPPLGGSAMIPKKKEKEEEGSQ